MNTQKRTKNDVWPASDEILKKLRGPAGRKKSTSRDIVIFTHDPDAPLSETIGHTRKGCRIVRINREKVRQVGKKAGTRYKQYIKDMA